MSIWLRTITLRCRPYLYSHIEHPSLQREFDAAPAAFNFDGENNVANRGIIEFIDGKSLSCEIHRNI